MIEAKDRATEFREIGEWSWWDTNSGSVLHCAEVEYDTSWDVGGNGTSACGIKTVFWIPGIFTRMGVERCKRCCKRTGFPEGTGSPKNDAACRELVKQRLTAGQ